MRTFTILWYAGGPEYAPNRVIARDFVRAKDLTAAIAKACNMLKAGRGNHNGYAHGFYVRKATEGDQELIENRRQHGLKVYAR